MNLTQILSIFESLTVLNSTLCGDDLKVYPVITDMGSHSESGLDYIGVFLPRG